MNQMPRSTVRILGSALTAIAVVMLVMTGQPGMAEAGVNDVLFGAASTQTEIDFSQVNASNFSDYFDYNGESTLSLTIGSNGEVQIGAIYTGDSGNNWYQMRIVVDSNDDGVFDVFDHSDSAHPWNARPDNGTPNNPDDDPTSWTYTYPADYIRTELRGESITVNWDTNCNCISNSFWDTWDQWSYEQYYGADKTDNWWMEAGQLMNVWWSGRDQNWNMLPNGDYLVQVWVDEDNNGQFEAGEANKTMLIAIETANITGTVRDANSNPIYNARVQAGSHLAWGEAVTATDGTFTVSGLQSGAEYHLQVQADGKVTGEKNINLTATTADAGIIALSDAISITGTLKLDRNANGVTDETADEFESFTNQWGWDQNDLSVWLNAHNTMGPGWGNGDVRFQIGDAAASFTINIPPPSGSAQYRLNVHAEGYAASPISVSVDANGGDAGTIVLTKASILTGSVKLPAAVDEWRHMDIQAISTSDFDERYWGWGQIDPFQGGGSETDTGQFRIDGIPQGTYNLEVRVMGYATKIVSDLVIVQGEDKNVGQLTIVEGSKITGTLTIQGDTTNLTRWEGDNSDPMNIWIDAWSHSAGWSGTNVEVARGVDQTVAFTLGGLSDASYEINTWLGEGYELVDENGNAPVFATVSGTAVKNLILKPYEGIVRGTISSDGITVDMSKVAVEVKRPWDWLPPKVATVANGGIDAATGEYTVSGLGTGDYVVKAGVYAAWDDWQGNSFDNLTGYNGQGTLHSDSGVGVVMQRAFVQNNASNPTYLNITFEQGYAISGTITLSTTDPPWHDFGDGTFDGQGQPDGDPDGIKNVDANPLRSEVISMAADLDGKKVRAMPMDMMFMGSEDPREGEIQPDGTYRIDGLAPGVYVLMPPAGSRRIRLFETAGDQQGHHFDGGERTHHWTTSTRLVVVGNADITGKDFELANGHTVTGQITLPEAQTVTQQGQEWQWVGHLELETATHEFLGHGKPLMKGDFNNGTRYEFTFHHVANGDYLVRFWTDRYVPGSAKFTVNNANASVNLSVETGANLVGKLIDADTGEAVTGDDGVRVICEAIPWVEGSWRETRNDNWSNSYIEDGSDLQNSGGGGAGGGSSSSRTNNNPGKFHLTAVPSGHKYIVRVETTNGEKSGGAKNYVGRVIAGIDVPEGATGDINVGTIKLKEGTTIKGRITDAQGNPIPGIVVLAEPSDAHDGSTEAEGVSDTNGYYTVYGVDPEIDYYDMFVAERPDMFDDWGKQLEWGEKRKYGIAPGATDVDFTLAPATATLSGTITIPAGAEFMLPFKGEGEVFPATFILLQKKGIIFDDMLDGIEGMSMPAAGGVTTSTYTIDNIEPGNYKLILMNYGLPTKVEEDLVIEAGSNTLDIVWQTSGYKVSGDLALATGGFPGSADINGVVCMNTADQSLTFGMLTQEADGTYSSYEVPGLASGQTYQLVFYLDNQYEDTPEIFTAGQPFTVSGDIADNTAVINRNSVPVLMEQAIQNPDDDSKIEIGIFSTTYLVDPDISIAADEPDQNSTAGEIYVSSGNGTLQDVTLSGDKRTIKATYVKGSGDSDVVITYAVHYGEDATTVVQAFSFNVNTLAMNSDALSTYLAGQVKLGSGDATQIYVPAGSLTTSDDGKAIVSIEKSDETPGSVNAAALVSGNEYGKLARAVTTELPSGAASAGDLYDFSFTAAGDSASATQVGTVTLQVQYDPNQVSNIDDVQILHLVNGQWVVESTNRTVDTENNTISVDVTSLSPFLAASVSSGTDVVSSGGGGGGSACFINSLKSAAAGPNAIIVLLLPVAFVLGAAIRKSFFDKK